MALAQQTRELLSYLRENPSIRRRIAAPVDQTVLYSGQLIKPAWKEIEELKRRYPELQTRKTLPEILEKLSIKEPYANLRQWTEAVDSIDPWKTNGFIAWRALSGIFASNAIGKVTFIVGSGVSADKKVFAATEISVLTRNSRIDQTTRELLGYYQRCISERRADIAVSYIPA